MDKLAVVQKAEDLGGTERREALQDIVIEARKLGCDLLVGGGTAGGINIRYGSIGYALLDLNTKGEVKLYVQPHPGKESTEEYVERLNAFIDKEEGLEPKNFPIGTYGHLEDPIEEVGVEAIAAYLKFAVEQMRKEYYEPYLEESAAA